MDLDQLRIEITELVDLDIDLISTGFSMQDVDIVLQDDSDDIEENTDCHSCDVSEFPTAQAGDCWLMGNHKVCCGDALNPATHESLLHGQIVHAVLTDPLYNVPIAGNVSGLGRKAHGEFAMASGELNDHEWQAFLDKGMKLLSTNLVAGGIIFAFMDWRSIHRLYAAGLAIGLNLVNLVVWYKEAGSMGGLYRSAYELVAVFCNGNTPRINNVGLGRHGRNRTNVWCAPGANRRGSSANEMLQLHATPKPVEICVDALLDVTERGDTVLDPFLGSGTTLIAAQKTGRLCYGIEIDARFIDVAVRRWEQFTGQEAVLAETGETFARVKHRRTADRAELAEVRHDGR